MIKAARLALVLGLAGAFAPSGTAQAPAKPPAALSQVEAHMNAVSTMTASFTQTDRAGRTLAGQMIMKRPGKVRFEYQKGVDTLVVADGKSLYFIDYSVRQLSRWPIGNSPLAILLDSSKDLSRVAKVVPAADPRIVMVEARDPKKPEFGAITLTFARSSTAPGGLMLQGWVALDSQGNRTTVRLQDQKFNVAVADSAFKFRDPRPRARGAR